MAELAIALTCLCLVLFAYCVWREREARVERDAILNAWQTDSEAWRSERTELLQRIQAPEQAVIAHAARERPKRRARTIAANDDAAFKKRNEREEKVTDG